MVRAGDIVADSLGRVAAEEHAAGVAQLGEQPFGVVHCQLDMLGGEAVCERRSFGQAAHHDHHAVLVPALPRNLRGREHRALHRHAVLDLIGEMIVVGDQDRLRRGIVLGLAEQVGGDPVGLVAAVGYDQDLARPCDHVDPDHAEQLALGLGDVVVARAGDHVDGANPFGAVGKRSDRLRSADAPDFVDPGEVRGGEHELVGLAARRGRDDD